MSDDQYRSGPHQGPGGDADPVFLPSTFSPWRSFERIPGDRDRDGAGDIGDDDYDLQNLAADMSRPTTPLSRNPSFPASDFTLTETGGPRSGQTPMPTSDPMVSPLSPSPSSGSQSPEQTKLPQQPETAARLPVPPRKSKFREMLTSLSTRRGDRSAYGAVRDLSGDHSYQGQYDEFGGFNGPSAASREEAINELRSKYANPPLDCHSVHDIYIPRWSAVFCSVIGLAIYSTLMNGVWFGAALAQPRYGNKISSTGGLMSPSTAGLLNTFFSTTILAAFITTVAAVVGQIATRKAIARDSKGVSLGLFTLRSWIYQPGSLVVNWDAIIPVLKSVAGVLAIICCLSSFLFLTASDALVRPKLKFGQWHQRELEGFIRSSYLNPAFVGKSCRTPIDGLIDEPFFSAESCMNVQYSGMSYRNLLGFMDTWKRIRDEGTSKETHIGNRPQGMHNLLDNTTMTATWIEREYSDVAKNFDIHKRIINNVTLAMPHPGVYAAATDPRNGILQPKDLLGLGEFSVRASVISPALNVMCVNMLPEELAPLVYVCGLFKHGTTWPTARNGKTDIPGQVIGEDDWFKDVPDPSKGEWLNRTVVDDIFRWGPEYGRAPPVFQMFPFEHNMIVNTTVATSTDMYILMKSNFTDQPDYTLCSLRSWASSACSTQLDVTGLSGGQMMAHCEDPEDMDAYSRVVEDVKPWMSPDWKNLVHQWQLSMDINGGMYNNNASNARILTQMILREPELNPLLPSTAEALAVYVSAALVVGSIQTTFRHYWQYGAHELDPGVYEQFEASVRTQQFASTYEEEWQKAFYVILALQFVTSVFCLFYLVWLRSGLVTDFTEPSNMFCLAINSPPSNVMKGSCGGGPNRDQLQAPWRISLGEEVNHYYFEEAPGAKAFAAATSTEPREGVGGRFTKSYMRLRKRKIPDWF